jgi:hypothetical protein
VVVESEKSEKIFIGLVPPDQLENLRSDQPDRKEDGFDLNDVIHYGLSRELKNGRIGRDQFNTSLKEVPIFLNQ